MSTNPDLTPANGLQGSSYIYNYGTTPNTRTVVSQKVRVLTPAYGENSSLHQMGVLSSFDPTESRSVEPVRGIGFGDQIAELVPGVTEPMTASFERAMLYLSNLWQATGYASGFSGPVRSLRHHRWPFDIEKQLVFSSLVDHDLTGSVETGASGVGFQGGVREVLYPEVTQGPGEATPNQGHTAIITMFEACWFTDWSTSFAADAGQVMESGSVIISDTHDFSSMYGEFLRTGNDPIVDGLGSIRFGEAGGAGVPTSAVG
jgi:hypothetical protein